LHSSTNEKPECNAQAFFIVLARARTYVEICFMATYKNLNDYMLELATLNKGILHSSTQKRFYTMSMEEFVLGVASELPTAGEKCNMIMIKFHNKLQHTTHTWNNLQVLFYIVKNCTNQTAEDELEAMDVCENVLDQILNRMNFDSLEGHPLFDGSFDEIDDVTIAPEEIYYNGIKFVGWSAYLELKNQRTLCYNPNDFEE
jgi:hypothetical protein